MTMMSVDLTAIGRFVRSRFFGCEYLSGVARVREAAGELYQTTAELHDTVMKIRESRNPMGKLAENLNAAAMTGKDGKP